MNYICNRNTTFNMTSKRFRPSLSPQLKVKFNFFFKSDYLNIFESQDSTTQLLQNLPSSNDYVCTSVGVEESLSVKDMVEAVEEAIRDRLDEDDREELIGLALEKVDKSFPTKTLPMFCILYLCFEIRIEHLHVYVVENDDYFPKISAADSSFAGLDKYEVHRVKEEKYCCICWEELCGGGGGGGAMRMPCSHVFHSGCIKQWLTTSHYCPLCRYEMPTM